MRSVFSPIVILFTVCILSMHILLADALPAPPGVPVPAPPKQIAVGFLKGRTDSLVFMCRGFHVWTLIPGTSAEANTLTYQKLTASEGKRDTESLGVMIAPGEKIILDEKDAATIQKLQLQTGRYKKCQWMMAMIDYLLKVSQPEGQRVGLSEDEELRIRRILEGVEKAQAEKEKKAWSSLELELWRTNQSAFGR
ncbi:hypothetical protein FB446DRAFT_722883 [Lentinula raphanica]|nr:hypothetical protein FB446DRAFT_722883 [Lentinula raphanica]